jgi:hypothetical protein
MSGQNVSDEDLVAFADGALEPGRAAELARHVAQDPRLARRVAALRESRRLLAESLDPVLEEPMPAHLLAAARGPVARPAARRPPVARWAIAASLALLIGAGTAALWPEDRPVLAIGPAAEQFAAILAEAPSGAERPLGGSTVRLVASHQVGNALCREFAWSAEGRRTGGLACRGASGWQVELLRALPEPQGAIRPAASGDPVVAEALELRNAGPVLSPEAERAALQRR